MGLCIRPFLCFRGRTLKYPKHPILKGFGHSSPCIHLFIHLFIIDFNRSSWNFIEYVCDCRWKRPLRKKISIFIEYVCDCRWKRPFRKKISRGGHGFADVCGNEQAKSQECRGRTTFQTFLNVLRKIFLNLLGGEMYL